MFFGSESTLTSGGRYYGCGINDLPRLNNNCVYFHVLSHTVSYLKHPRTTGKQITTLLPSLKWCYNINKPAAVCVSDSCCDSPDTVQLSQALLKKTKTSWSGSPGNTLQSTYLCCCARSRGSLFFHEGINVLPHIFHTSLSFTAATCFIFNPHSVTVSGMRSRQNRFNLGSFYM